MALDLTFKQICDLIKKDQKDDAQLIAAVDKLLGLAMVFAPVALGPAGLALLPFIAVKNEITRLGKSVFERFTAAKDDDYVARQRRMQVGHGLICFTAFFDALDRQLPEALRRKIHLLAEERNALAETAQAEAGDRPGQTALPGPGVPPGPRVPFPHPTETLSRQVERNRELWTQMAEGFTEFVRGLAIWDDAGEEEQQALLDAIATAPQVAEACYVAQYFELARRYQDFAVWANLQQHEQTQALIQSLAASVQQHEQAQLLMDALSSSDQQGERLETLIGSLSDCVRQHMALTASARTAIDVGFTRLRQTVLGIPELLKVSRAEEVVEYLTRHYEARLDEPIVDEKDGDSEAAGPRLRFPRVRDAFVPQSFQVLRYGSDTGSLEDEATWKGLERRDDLHAFLLAHLSSPYSTEAPLLILGHPGSGKSLLTTVLAAQMMSRDYTPIRVPLREVNADAPVAGQIDQAISLMTHVSVEPWATLSAEFKNSPPLVILDGYDELLQATRKVFGNYLLDVQGFQRGEAEQGHPVRAIVTSRVTLIDKATIPPGATIIRLLEFDKRQRDAWISIWNAENADYFRAAGIERFALPDEEAEDADRVLALAQHPLLLLMLALYDSESNELRTSASLDRTTLYDRLLRRFVRREREKDEGFRNLDEPGKEGGVQAEMTRLSVAALGMYNRRKLHILSRELDEDIRLFGLERPVPEDDRALTQAELLLGSFFFVHKSRVQVTTGTAEHHEGAAAFEFLHNTFGEFLTADFILRGVVTEAAKLKKRIDDPDLRLDAEQRLRDPNGLPTGWFAGLAYTPLFTRPVVLEMMREWTEKALDGRKWSREEFLPYLDRILLSQFQRLLEKREMPLVLSRDAAQEGSGVRFHEYPLLGHLAIYSINLILLRVAAGDGPWVFDEGQLTRYDDGTRPWDRLTHIWRSWFSLEVLNGLTGIFTARREGATVTISANGSFQAAERTTRLETCARVAKALGDNLSGGIAGLMLFDPSVDDLSEIDDAHARLESERVHLNADVLLKRLGWYARRVDATTADDFRRRTHLALNVGRRSGSESYLVQVALSVAAGFRRLLDQTLGNREMGLPMVEIGKAFRDAVRVETASMIAGRAPLAAIVLCQTAREVGDSEWIGLLERRTRDRFPTRAALAEELLSASGVLLDWARLRRELGGAYASGSLDLPRLPEALAPDFLVRWAEHNPWMGLELLQLARDALGIHFSEAARQAIVQRVLQPQCLLGLSNQKPEVALEWLRLAQEAEDALILTLADWKYVRRLLVPYELLELSERDPQVALECLRLAQRWLGLVINAADAHPPEHMHIGFPGTASSHLKRLARRQPGVALGWLQLVQTVGDMGISRRIEDQVRDGRLASGALTRLAYGSPEGMATLLRLARDCVGMPLSEQIIEALGLCLRELGSAGARLDDLPVSAVADLEWFSRQTTDEGVRGQVRDWLQTIGFSPRA